MNQETDTDASRILFIDSKDGENTASDKQLTTRYKIHLQEPIVIPNHHTLLLSLHRLNVPRTFYNFQHKRNAGVEVIFLNKNGTSGATGTWCSNANQVPYLSFEIDEGNYDAISMRNLLLTRVNNYLNTGKASDYQPHGVVNLITGGGGEPTQAGLFKLEINYNRNSLKYEWAMNKIDGTNPTLDIMTIFRWRTGELYGTENSETINPTNFIQYRDTSIRQEVGFITNKWNFQSLGDSEKPYDYWLSYSNTRVGGQPVGTENGEWDYGYGVVQNNSGSNFVNTAGTSSLDGTWFRRTIRSKHSLTTTEIDNDRYYFRGNGTPAGLPLAQPNYFSVIDVNYHTQNIYLHTSLTQHSVLDSRIGCRYSDILARIPVDVSSGGAIEVSPSDGSVHKLMLKVREITSLEVRLTDLNDKLIDTQGLDWTFSLEFDFIVSPKLEVKKPLRQTIEEKKYAHFLHRTGKKDELKDFLERRNNELLPNV